jgi:hypothetical protein
MFASITSRSSTNPWTIGTNTGRLSRRPRIPARASDGKNLSSAMPLSGSMRENALLSMIRFYPSHCRHPPPFGDPIELCSMFGKVKPGPKILEIGQIHSYERILKVLQSYKPFSFLLAAVILGAIGAPYRMRRAFGS